MTDNESLRRTIEAAETTKAVLLMVTMALWSLWLLM